MLVVERYDRTMSTRRCARTHPPGGYGAKRWRRSGSTSRAADRRCARSRGSKASMEQICSTRLILNWMVGNIDGHAKNFSVLEPGTARARLAPAYDVLCAETYPGARQGPRTQARSGGLPRGGDARQSGAGRRGNWRRRRAGARAGAIARRIGRRGGGITRARPVRSADHGVRTSYAAGPNVQADSSHRIRGPGKPGTTTDDRLAPAAGAE